FSQSSALGNGNLFDVGVGYSGFPAQLQSSSQTVGVANILITFPVPVVGFALNYDTFSGSDVTFTLSNGDTFTQGSSATGYDLLNFVGATDSGFTSVLVTSADEVLNISNISYALAPEPGSCVLLGVGATALVALVRRKRMKSGI